MVKEVKDYVKIIKFVQMCILPQFGALCRSIFFLFIVAVASSVAWQSLSARSYCCALSARAIA